MSLLFPVFLRELNMYSIIFRFILCMLCGGIIGIEREKKHRTAGFRTHILVCVGAAVAMMTGQFIFETMSHTADPARLGAQIISGIGFLGVGTIIVTKGSRVKGLTTAAGLWVSACIGIAIGIGFYEIAILATITVLITVVVMLRIDDFIWNKEYNFSIYVEVEDNTCLKNVFETIDVNLCKIQSVEFKKQSIKNAERAGILFQLSTNAGKENADILFQKLVSLEKVNCVRRRNYEFESDTEGR